jgi:hypothetical protein
MEDVDKHLLVRAIGLSALGKLDKNTIKLASTMKELVVLKISSIRKHSKGM